MQNGSSGVDRRRFIKTAAAVGLAGPALAGCSGDGGSGGSGGDSGGNGGDGGNGASGGNGNDAGGDGDESSGGGGVTVAAGPNANTKFDPEEVTISTGDTVTWEFESVGHNVECKPSESDEAALPDGADPFASYDGDDRFSTMDQGDTFEHTFDVAGEYTYVCVPHASVGMVGTVVVE